MALWNPHYPKAGHSRRLVGMDRMLRIHFLQQWFNLSEPGAEEVLCDPAAMRRFVGARGEHHL
jgi:IS5 family transposase